MTLVIEECEYRILLAHVNPTNRITRGRRCDQGCWTYATTLAGGIVIGR